MPLNHLSNNFFHINLTLSQKHILEQISRPTSAFSSKYQIARICNVFLERMNWPVGKIGFARAKRIRSIFTALRLLVFSPIIKTHLVRKQHWIRHDFVSAAQTANDVYYYRVPNCNRDKHRCALLRG